MPDLEKKSALELIRSNIAKHGHHIYLVQGSEAVPRYAYTIGLREPLGAELVFAGAAVFYADDVTRVINEVAGRLTAGTNPSETAFTVEPLGTFSLQVVDASWASELLLGASDFYGVPTIPALQILPDEDHWTIDVPNLARAWSATAEPVWRWRREPWAYPVPRNSLATTNLDALRGGRITEAARWEEEQWELFAGAGPDVPPDEIRVVPLGTLLAVDQSLDAVTQLDVGRALWRDAEDGDWNRWG
jgi:hypothetical protein